MPPRLGFGQVYGGITVLAGAMAREVAMRLWDWLFDPAGLTPHGFCLIWAPGLISLHVVSDLITGLSYFSIPLALAWFVRQRPDLHYVWVVYLFSAFILACGLTHIMSILTLWVPAYGIEGLVKLVTAGLSVATAIQLWPLIPRVLALPTPAQLSRLNSELSNTIQDQARTAALLRASESEVRAANSELERRVEARTADLKATNAQLVAALRQRELAEVELQAAKRDLESVVEERTTALKQRDLLLREVYHRVKNNLQIVDSLIMLQARKLSDPEAREALTGLRSRIYALGLVHQQLMTSTDLQSFDIAPFLQELSANILDGTSNRVVALAVEVCPLVVTLDFAIPLGLLVTELLTNALKHATLTPEPRIWVLLERCDDDEIVLAVADNAGDRTADSSEQISEARPGNRTIAGLVAQLGGTMTVCQQDGMRTEVRLSVAETCP